MPVLALESVWKTYDGTTDVLRGVDLRVAEGEAVVIAGENGSGKTTLLNLAGALDVPTRGTVSVGGRVVGGMTERERSDLRLRTIGFVFQDHELIEELTVLQNVMLPLRLARAAGREARAAEVLAAFGLAGLAARRPGAISTGQRQLAAVARALANGPALVLADEPTASLDPANGALVLGALRQANRERGVAVVLTSPAFDATWPGARRFALRDGNLVPA